MHGLLTHLIHPALRTALLSWLIARGAFALLCLRHGRSLAPKPAALLEDGALGARLLAALHDVLGPELGAMVCAGAGELMILLGIWCVYDFCRKDALPQTAERATWLFALSPLLLLLTPVSAASFAIPLGLLAITSAVHGRFLIGASAAAIATSLMPATLLLTPALGLLGWRARQPGKTAPYHVPLLTLSPLATLSGSILLGLMLGGAGDVSLRGMTRGPALRELTALSLHSLSLSDGLFLGALLFALASAVRFWQSTPRSWPLLVLPLCLWPLLHAESAALSPLMLLAIPLFAYLAKLTEDPALERLALIASALLTATLLG